MSTEPRSTEPIETPEATDPPPRARREFLAAIAGAGVGAAAAAMAAPASILAAGPPVPTFTTPDGDPALRARSTGSGPAFLAQKDTNQLGPTIVAERTGSPQAGGDHAILATVTGGGGGDALHGFHDAESDGSGVYAEKYGPAGGDGVTGVNGSEGGGSGVAGVRSGDTGDGPGVGGHRTDAGGGNGVQGVRSGSGEGAGVYALNESSAPGHGLAVDRNDGEGDATISSRSGSGHGAGMAGYRNDGGTGDGVFGLSQTSSAGHGVAGHRIGEGEGDGMLARRTGTGNGAGIHVENDTTGAGPGLRAIRTSDDADRYGAEIFRFGAGSGDALAAQRIGDGAGVAVWANREGSVDGHALVAERQDGGGGWAVAAIRKGDFDWAAVYAEGKVALHAAGRLQTTRAGYGAIAGGASAGSVEDLTAVDASHVSVSLLADPGPGIAVAWVERAESSFTVHLTGAAGQEVPFSWFLVEPA